MLYNDGTWEGKGDGSLVGDRLDTGSLSMGYIGLAETLIILTGKHHGQSEKSQELGLKIVFMGFGLDSDNLHSPNEKYDIVNFYKGIETIPYFHKYFAEKNA